MEKRRKFMRIPITKRLKTAAEMIGHASVLCDIGCDHGYLPIYLIQKGQIKSSYACDLRDGPLKTASKNIAAFHMKDKIQTIKSDGLHELADLTFDVISICGMGGRLIAEILERDNDAEHRQIVENNIIRNHRQRHQIHDPVALQRLLHTAAPRRLSCVQGSYLHTHPPSV